MKKRLLTYFGIEAFRTIWGYRAIRVKNHVFFYDPHIRGIINMPLSDYEEFEQDMIAEQDERWAEEHSGETREKLDYFGGGEED